MSPTLIWSVSITAGGFILNLVILLSTLAYRAGKFDMKVQVLEAKLGFLETNVATKDEVSSIKESLAEIKGMFRLQLKEPT